MDWKGKNKTFANDMTHRKYQGIYQKQKQKQNQPSITNKQIQ